MRIRTSAIAVVLWLIAASTATAQTTGTLAGTLVDSQGLPIPGATVTVTGPQGAKSFVSDAEGRFQAPFLVPGNYDVRAELQGFKIVEITGVAVSLGQVSEVAIKMEVGGLSETVQVVGSTVIVDTTSTTTGAVLTSDLLLAGGKTPAGFRSRRERCFTKGSRGESASLVCRTRCFCVSLSFSLCHSA